MYLFKFDCNETKDIHFNNKNLCKQASAIFYKTNYAVITKQFSTKIQKKWYAISGMKPDLSSNTLSCFLYHYLSTNSELLFLRYVLQIKKHISLSLCSFLIIYYNQENKTLIKNLT